MALGGATKSFAHKLSVQSTKQNKCSEKETCGGSVRKLGGYSRRSWGCSQDDEKRRDSNSCIESAGIVAR